MGKKGILILILLMILVLIIVIIGKEKNKYPQLEEIGPVSVQVNNIDEHKMRMIAEGKENYASVIITIPVKISSGSEELQYYDKVILKRLDDSENADKEEKNKFPIKEFDGEKIIVEANKLVEGDYLGEFITYKNKEDQIKNIKPIVNNFEFSVTESLNEDQGDIEKMGEVFNMLSEP